MTFGRSFVAGVALSMVLLGGGASRCWAAIAGAENPKAPTHHDVIRGRLDFNKRTLAGAYQAVGKRDPKWDAQAIKFLDAMAICFSYGPEAPVYRTVEPPPVDAMKALAKAATDAGCDDPLVIYCATTLLEDGADEPAELLDAYEKATDGMVERKYPAVRVAGGGRRIMALLPLKKADVHAERQKYPQLAWDSNLASADVTDDRDLRPAKYLMDLYYNSLPEVRRTAFCEALAKRPSANPWIVAVYGGAREIQEAWKSRGNGWANTVTDEGWRGFYEHMTKARELLVKAHKLHPDFPDAASEMITVAMGAGGRFGDSTREWFDATVKAQFDYPAAYDAYIEAIDPRWGGTHERMFQFGLECAETKRYDTYVPYYLLRVVERINTGSSDDFAIFSVPPVRTALRQMLTNSYQAARDPGERNAYLGKMMAMEWRIGEFRAAGMLADKLGEQIDPSVFVPFRGWGPEALSQVRAMTSPEGPTIVDAEAKASRGEFEAALSGFTKASQALGADHPVKLFLRYRMKAMAMQRDFAAGKDVVITPEADLTPWAIMEGDWRVEKDGTVTATSDDSGSAVLVCRADFGHSYELEARIASADPRRPTIPALFVEWTGYRRYSSGGIITSVSSAYVGGGQSEAAREKIPLTGNDLVMVRVSDGKLSLFVNGKAVIENRPAHEVGAGQAAFVGMGITSQYPGRTAKFSQVKIRKVLSEGAKP